VESSNYINLALSSNCKIENSAKLFARNVFLAVGQKLYWVQGNEHLFS